MTSPLFRFGIISDTHVRAPGGDLSSPFPVNEKANTRAAYAATLLADYNPVFTVHLGDMVHPLPHMGAYDAACEEAKKLFAPLGASINFVAGNHDIGDKPMPASPASGVDASGTSKYRSHFGEPYYRIDHDAISLLIINSSLVNTDSTDEQEQRQWLETELENLQKDGRRVFLFSHYPPFIHDSEEPEHYDNYAQPGRNWLLSLLEQYQVEVVFSGHVHHFFRNRYKNTDLYCLPATSFTRQDFAELFRVEPADEFGRDDSGKMHVAVVDVYEKGYQLHLIPTEGAGQDSELMIMPLVQRSSCIVHVRHAWYESVDLPYNGPMEEFSRKRARNDYTLLRLLQMGLRDVRVPLQDVLDPGIRSSLENYHHSGIRFHAFSLGVPADELLHRLSDLKWAGSLECVMPAYPKDKQSLDDFLNQLQPIATALDDIPVWLGAARSSSSTVDQTDKVYAHSVSSGFAIDDCDRVMECVAAVNQRANHLNVVGAIFQLPWEGDPATAFEKLQSCCERINTSTTEDLPLSVQLVVRFAPTNPAKENADDAAIASRVRQVMNLVNGYPLVTLQFDTFADMDRGYAPRHGFVDRRFNLREAGRALVTG